MKLSKVAGYNSAAMELVQAYLDKAKKIGGLYVLATGELPNDDAQELMYNWHEFEEAGYIDAPLIVIPNETLLTYENRFSFERAMQIIRAGGQVRRLIWNPKAYLFLDDKEGMCRYQVDERSSDYVISQDDLEAIDWILFEEYA